MFTFKKKKNISWGYVIWEPKLDVPKSVYRCPTALKYSPKLQPSVLRVFKIQKIYNIKSSVASFFVEAGANRFTTE